MPKREQVPTKPVEAGKKETKSELYKLPPSLEKSAKELLAQFLQAKQMYQTQLDMMVSSYLLGKEVELGDNDTVTLSDDHSTVIVLRK